MMKTPEQLKGAIRKHDINPIPVFDLSKKRFPICKTGDPDIAPFTQTLLYIPGDGLNRLLIIIYDCNLDHRPDHTPLP